MKKWSHGKFQRETKRQGETETERQMGRAGHTQRGHGEGVEQLVCGIWGIAKMLRDGKEERGMVWSVFFYGLNPGL